MVQKVDRGRDGQLREEYVDPGHGTGRDPRRHGASEASGTLDDTHGRDLVSNRSNDGHCATAAHVAATLTC